MNRELYMHLCPVRVLRYLPYSIKKSILPIVIRGVLFGLEFVKYSV